MAGIVAFPEVVQQALRDFGDLFANEPQRRHFGEYLTGLYVAAKKTVTGHDQLGYGTGHARGLE
jgi:hypothetical protein